MSDYSEVASAQLDDLESSAADDFWDAILDACELVLDHPDRGPEALHRHGDRGWFGRLSAAP